MMAETPKRVTLVVAYYENPVTLRWQLDGWERFPEPLRERLQVIVVDDGSPDHPAADVLRDDLACNVRLYRIEVDVRWNQDAARNIGVAHAEDAWILLTDIDHVVTAALFDSVIHGIHDPEVIYRFSRRELGGKRIRPHANSWLMTRDMYWRVGGYDEALAGYYGTDEEFRHRCAATAPVRTLADELLRREHYGDSSTTRYLRKQPEDAAIATIVNARTQDWKPRVLSFPYHEVAL